MVGWIGFSCLPAVGGIADIRDAVQAILNGDPLGAAMNAAGVAMEHPPEQGMRAP